MLFLTLEELKELCSCTSWE